MTENKENPIEKLPEEEKKVEQNPEQKKEVHSEKKHKKKDRSREKKKHKKSKDKQEKKKHKSKKHKKYSSSSSGSYSSMMERKKNRQSKFDKPPQTGNPTNMLTPGSSGSVNMHLALQAIRQQKLGQAASGNPNLQGGNMQKPGSQSGEPSISVVPPELQFQFKHARRVYVGNVPEHVTSEHLIEFIYRTLEMAGGLLEPGNPIIGSELEMAKKYMFLEMRSIEETDAAMQLDGIIYQGKSLRFRRPRDYENFGKVKGVRPVPKLNLELIGMSAIATQVSEGPNKLFVAGIPIEYDEGMAIENLNLKAFGNLQAFHLVKDKATNISRGFAFLSFDTEEATDRCINSLNGFQIQGRILKCKKATTNQQAEQNKKNLMQITSLTDSLTSGTMGGNFIPLNYQQQQQQPQQPQQFDQQQMLQQQMQGNFQYNPQQFSQLTGIYPPPNM